MADAAAEVTDAAAPVADAAKNDGGWLGGAINVIESSISIIHKVRGGRNGGRMGGKRPSQDGLTAAIMCACWMDDGRGSRASGCRTPMACRSSPSLSLYVQGLGGPTVSSQGKGGGWGRLTTDVSAVVLVPLCRSS